MTSQNKDAPLTHLDAEGRAQMVDVGGKVETHRVAVAWARLRIQPTTLARIESGQTPKGDVLATARIAGIQAAKRTWELIPLCHPIPLTSCQVEIELLEDRSGVGIRATAETHGKTGVEMEALTAASIAGLTLYDMLKAVDRGMTLEAVHLVEKRGGRSGDYHAAKLSSA